MTQKIDTSMLEDVASKTPSSAQDADVGKVVQLNASGLVPAEYLGATGLSAVDGRQLALEIADLKGATLNFGAGQADAFDADTIGATSTNEFYDATNDWYEDGSNSDEGTFGLTGGTNHAAWGDGNSNGKHVAHLDTVATTGNLSSVKINVDSVSTSFNAQCSVYSNNSGSPGTIVGGASGTVSISETGDKTFTWASGGPYLNSGNTYWFIFSDVSGGSGNATIDYAAYDSTHSTGNHDTITSITSNTSATARVQFAIAEHPSEVETIATYTGHNRGDAGMYVEVPTTSTTAAQSFTVSSTDPISKVRLWTTASGPNISMRIETDNSGVPSGTLVASGAEKASTAAQAGGHPHMALTTPFYPTPGTTYWAVFQSTDDTALRIGLTKPNAASSTYANGNAYWTGGGTSGDLDMLVYQLTQPRNMTLVSGAMTADTAPTTGRISVQAEFVESATVNTHMTAEISRDGGTTWSLVTLTAGATNANFTMYSGEAALSSQPSGTSMKYRIKTLQNKRIRVSGAVLRWS
tara:strand:- start:4927 stop:6495 length:1569 start_codon:yes stop_codon:yes gene_type:complete